MCISCVETKNFNVCFRGGKDRDGEMRYNPFRITPYLLKVQGKGSSGEEEEPCCLALAERIISGYEGTNISTTNCTTLETLAQLILNNKLFIYVLFFFFCACFWTQLFLISNRRFQSNFLLIHSRIVFDEVNK